MNFHPHFSDESAQNTATTFQTTKNFIHQIYYNNFLIKDGIIYDTINGFSKQYRCANQICILSVLAFKNKLIIDICINAPGRGLKYINMVLMDTARLETNMCIIGTEESNNEDIIINAASIACEKDQ